MVRKTHPTRFFNFEPETSAKIMQNSRARLYFAGEGACSTR